MSQFMRSNTRRITKLSTLSDEQNTIRVMGNNEHARTQGNKHTYTVLLYFFLNIDLPTRLSRHCMVNLGDDRVFVYGGVTIFGVKNT